MSYTVVAYAQKAEWGLGTPAPATPDDIMNDDFYYGADEAEFDERPRLGDLDEICAGMWLDAVCDCLDRDDGLEANAGTHRFYLTAFVLNPDGKPVWKSKTFADKVSVTADAPRVEFAE